MRKSALWIVAVLAVLVGIVWFVGRPGDANEIEPVDAAPSPTAETAELEAEPAPDLDSPVEIALDRTEAVEVPAEREPDYPRSRVFGLVHSEIGNPLAGVKVNMYSVGGRWVSEALYPAELPDFVTTTDALGAFELDVPLPTSDWISISIRPPVFHTRAGREFGPAGGRDEEPVREGDNDLGTFVLMSAGGFEGRVFDQNGLPIAKARVRLDDSYPGGYVIGASAGEDGVYRVGHVPEGTYNVEALAKGFVTQKVSAVEVVNGDITPGIDFLLSRASSIAGRVVDTDGKPLEKVRLWGWPQGSGQGAGARSAADGSFTIYLPQNEPYTLEAELAGYEKFDTGHARHFDPGTEDIEIVLLEPDLTTYVVRDARTDAPIERFGLKIITVRTEHGSTSSSDHREAARVTDHPGGEVRMRGSTRFDDYTIVAPGYGPQRGKVQHDEGEEGRQTIRLYPAGSITGRFVMNGEPLPSATIRITGDRVPLKPGVTTGEDDIFSSAWGMDVDEFAGERRQHRGDADGDFRITDLAPGTYELGLTANGAAPRVVERLLVEVGRTTELGDVEAFAPGEIHGMIVLAGGFSPGGIVVATGSEDFADDEKAQTTDVSGRFVFTGLAEGKQYLWIEEKSEILLPGEPIEVELARGEIRDLQLDLTHRIPSKLEVEVRLAGQPLEGATVQLLYAGSRHAQRLGVTNADGIATRQVRAGNDVVVEVLGSAGLLAGHAAPQSLLAGERERIEVALNPGRLKIAFASELMDAENAPRYYFLQLASPGEEYPQSTRFESAELKLVDGERRGELGWIAPGEYTVILHIGRKKLRADVVIESGDETSATLTE